MGGVGAADPVVGHVHGHAPVRAPDPHGGVGRAGVLRDVGERLRDDEVGRALHRPGQALVGFGLERHRHRDAGDEPVERRRRARARSGPRGGCRAPVRAARPGSSAAPPVRGRAAPPTRGPPARASARSGAGARARPGATARRRAGRAPAAGARRRRLARAARATRAAPPTGRAALRRAWTTWVRSRPPRNANGVTAVATNAAHQAASPRAGPGHGHEHEREQRARCRRA